MGTHTPSGIDGIHLTALRNRASSSSGMRPVEQFEVLAILSEIDRLKAINAELLEALEIMVSVAVGMPVSHDDLRQGSLDVAVEESRAAIASAKEQSNG